MGYQQKLLYISGLLVIGVAILVGIQKFKSTSMAANLDALKLDLLEIAAKAQGYYAMPKCLEGGGRSFSGLATDPESFKKLFVKPQNANGTFKIVSVTDNLLVIQATGLDDHDDDGQNLTVEVKVYPDSVQTLVINY